MAHLADFALCSETWLSVVLVLKHQSRCIWVPVPGASLIHSHHSLVLHNFAQGCNGGSFAWLRAFKDILYGLIERSWFCLCGLPMSNWLLIWCMMHNASNPFLKTFSLVSAGSEHSLVRVCPVNVQWKQTNDIFRKVVLSVWQSNLHWGLALRTIMA